MIALGAPWLHMTEDVPQHAETTELAALAALADRVARSAGDDKQAEEQLCRAFARRIRLYGLRQLRDSHAAGDFTQEVLIVVLEALRAGRIEKPESIAAFMLGTCRTVVRDWRRNQARRGSLLTQYVTELLPRVEPEQVPFDRARLGQCLDELPSRERQVIYDSFMLEKAVDQIAASLETSVGNVRVLRHRAIAKLRVCMDGQERAS
jgi:RNA polymerase sigma-70 factor, ECF subfamily